jgi:type I restriction enzyme, S subunit
MSGLPRRWAWSTVGELGHVMLGRQRAPKYHSGDNMRPYLRVKNVFEDRIDISDVMEMQFSPQEFERYKLEPGDILLNEGQSPELVGRPAMYRGEMPGACFTNSLIRFRAGNAVDPLFALYLFRYYLHAGRFQREARITTNIAHLSASRFSSIEIALPPLAEQRRIVAAIEEQFSRVEAASESLLRARKRLTLLWSSALSDAVAGDWPIKPLNEIAHTTSGGTPSRRRPDYFGGPIPWVKSGELRDGRVGTTEETITELGLAESSAKIFERGTLLIALYGATVGKLGILEIEAATNQAVCAIKPHDPEMVPYLWVVLRQKRAELVAAGQGGAQPNISQAILRRLRIPVPPLDEQRRIVAAIEHQLSLVGSLRDATASAERRAAALRRSILVRAFRGELVPEDSNDEPASALLERIEAERAMAPAPTRKPRQGTPA